MMRYPRRVLSVRLFAMVSLAAVWGCGSDGYEPPEGVVVTGKLVQDGQPLEMKRPDVGLGQVRLTLIPVAGGEAEYAAVATDGSFSFPGPGDGIPPGEYELAVFHNQNGDGVDQLQGRFDEESTPIELTVPKDAVGGKHDLGTIDLKNY